MGSDDSPETLATVLYAARSQGLGYRVGKSTETLRRELGDTIPIVSHLPMAATRFPFYEVSISTAIGSRASQEDRFVFCPEVVPGCADTAFFGVFDGTVGDFASDTVKGLVVPHLVATHPWERVVKLLTGKPSTQYPCATEADILRHDAPEEENIPIDRRPDGVPAKEQQSGVCVQTRATTTSESIGSSSSLEAGDAFERKNRNNDDDELPKLLWIVMDWMYLNADTELLELCSIYEKDYASSTSATVLLAGGYVCVGHLGDSRVAIGYERDGILYGEFLTEDHKPNMLREQERILRCGGSVEYLQNHYDKPFIRGGDFTARKSRGEQPMQLQYSRAFGGKDLKKYGLSSQPDLKVFRLDPTHHVFILASDGIWDVQTAGRAVEIAMTAKRRGDDPASALVQLTLDEQRLRNQNADNLTVIVVFPDSTKYIYEAAQRRDQARSSS